MPGTILGSEIDKIAKVLALTKLTFWGMKWGKTHGDQVNIKKIKRPFRWYKCYEEKVIRLIKWNMIKKESILDCIFREPSVRE